MKQEQKTDLIFAGEIIIGSLLICGSLEALLTGNKFFFMPMLLIFIASLIHPRCRCCYIGHYPDPDYNEYRAGYETDYPTHEFVCKRCHSIYSVCLNGDFNRIISTDKYDIEKRKK